MIFTSGPNSAIDDLQYLPVETKRRLCQLAPQLLRKDPDPADQDDQRLNDEFRLRRAILPEESKALESTTQVELTEDLAVYDIWYVYRGFTPAEIRYNSGRDGFYVVRIVDSEQLAYLAQKLLWPGE